MKSHAQLQQNLRKRVLSSPLVEVVKGWTTGTHHIDFDRDQRIDKKNYEVVSMKLSFPVARDWEMALMMSRLLIVLFNPKYNRGSGNTS